MITFAVIQSESIASGEVGKQELDGSEARLQIVHAFVVGYESNG